MACGTAALCRMTKPDCGAANPAANGGALIASASAALMTAVALAAITLATFNSAAALERRPSTERLVDRAAHDRALDHGPGCRLARALDGGACGRQTRALDHRPRRDGLLHGPADVVPTLDVHGSMHGTVHRTMHVDGAVHVTHHGAGVPVPPGDRPVRMPPPWAVDYQRVVPGHVDDVRIHRLHRDVA